MAQQLINNGTTAGDGTGEVLFNAFDKTNDNFTELYSRIKEVQVVVSTAQLKDLLANPKVLIPAAGAGKVIKLISMTGFLNYGTVAFNFTHDLDIKYQTSGIVIYNGQKADWNQANDYYFNIDKAGGGGGQLSANEGVVLTTVADATLGDGFITIVALYSEQDFNITP
tara:strand:- start:88 stop:591 length:504 start_codon:yes stop_codon:yes gene_type:complete